MREILTLEKLVDNFIWNREIIDSISNNNALSINYMINKEWFEYLSTPNFIKYILLDNIFCYNWEVDIKNLINNIENIEIDFYIEPYLTHYDEDTLWTYFYFYEYTNVKNWDKDIIQILKRSQYEWLYKLYYDTLNNFIIYIRHYYHKEIIGIK